MKERSTYLEFRPSRKDDMIDGVPAAFDNEIDGKARIAMVDPYGMIFPYGDTAKKPLWVMRHANTDKFRFGSIFYPGDGIFGLQEALHMDEMAQKDTPIEEAYHPVSEDPVLYRIASHTKKCSIDHYENCCIWKEGDFLDLKGIPYPFAIVDHADIFPTLSQFMQPCIWSGYLDGRPVIGMGNYDRIYLPQAGKDIGDDLSYILSYGHGIREDGRLETYLICLHADGSNIGLYYIDGKEPLFTHDMKMETVWKKLPYVDDGTCAYQDAIFHIGPKTIHMKGLWGSKGFTPYPRYEKHGQSETYGTWYEGDIEYRHKLYFHTCENMDAYPERLRALGFEVEE